MLIHLLRMTRGQDAVVVQQLRLRHTFQVDAQAHLRIQRRGHPSLQRFPIILRLMVHQDGLHSSLEGRLAWMLTPLTRQMIVVH